jgi:hypothetical protein
LSIMRGLGRRPCFGERCRSGQCVVCARVQACVCLHPHMCSSCAFVRLRAALVRACMTRARTSSQRAHTASGPPHGKHTLCISCSMICTDPTGPALASPPVTAFRRVWARTAIRCCRCPCAFEANTACSFAALPPE